MADRVVKYVFQGDIKGLQASMSAAGASVNKFAGDLSKLDKDGAKMRQSLTAVGNTAGKIGLVAAAGLGAAIGVAANFDQAMSNVKAATHETAANMDALREAAIKAGADTAFSASEAAAGIENLAKAGVDTANILGGGLQGALDLAAAGGMEVADAAEAAAGAMAQFKLEGDQVPHIADLLAAAAGKAQGDVSDMVMALKQAGTVSAQTGLTLEETTGALAAMAEQSLLGSDAGTSFKTMLAALTPNSEKAAAAMEEYNIHAFDAQGNFVGMTELAGQLRDGLGGLTDEQRAMTLETIFGSDAVRAASIIYDNGADGIAKWTSEVNDAGYASETAAIRLDNLKGDLEAFKGSLETALIGVGEGSQGPLRSLVQGATDAVNAFNKLPAGVQSSVTAVLGATALLGGGLFVGSKVVQGIADTRQALTNLGIDAGKTTRAMKGLAAASAGLAVGFAAAAAIRAIQEATDETLPGIETLTNQLLNVQTVGLASEFDSVGESLRRLNDDSKTFEEKWGDLAFGQMGKVAQLFGGPDGVAGSVREATAEIDALDQAFSNIATQAGPEKAMQVFRDFAAAQHLSVSEQRDLLDRMPLLGEAFASTSNDAKLAADGVGDVAGAMSEATAEAYTLENAMGLLFGKVDVDAALVSWKRGLAELKGAVKDNAKTLDVNTKAGQDNRDAIRGNVNDLRSWAEKVYEQNGNLDGLRARLLKGREAIIAQAEAAGFSKKETEAYLKELGLTPKEIRTDVNLMGVPEAEADINGVQVKLSALDRTVAQATMRARDEASSVIAAIRNSMLSLHDKTIYIRAVHTESRLQLHAAGGPVYGAGTATSDSIPAMLSNGEYVVKAAAVDKYGVRMFDQLNAMRYAEGGAVRAQRSSTVTTNNYGPSGPMQISGRLQMSDGRIADITGVIDDRIAANRRHDRATGRRK